MRIRSGFAPAALPDVYEGLKSVVVHADPLHVAGVVRAACAKRRDVVDVPAGADAADLARGGTGVVGAERANLRAVTREGVRAAGR